MRSRFISLVFLTCAIGACIETIKNPYPYDAGSDAAGGAGEGGDGPKDAGPDADPTIGGPCLTDGDCDDEIDCTFDACDETIDKCRFTPDDMSCQDSVYCNGIERCDNKLGCTFGEVISCNDNDSCTIDACVEVSKSCKHGPRDADFDTDPDVHCGGGDCDDADPNVSSLTAEVCANFKDDDCDGVLDEPECGTPLNDLCADALEIDAPGSYAMDTTASGYEYPTSCTQTLAGPHDVVAAIVLPAGDPVDVEVTARTMYQDVAVGIAGQCGDPATELACNGSFTMAPPNFGKISKAIGRGLGSTAETTAYPVYVTTAPQGPVIVDVAIAPAEPKPTNETCGTALAAPVGAPFPVKVIDASKDLASLCNPPLGELVYSFTLDDAADVDVFGTSVDGDGVPVLSLRDGACAAPEDEITCHTSPSAHVVAKSLPAGTYFLGVSATVPTSMLVTIELSPPTPPAPDDDCEGAPIIEHNKTLAVSLEDHQDNVQLGCVAGAVDAVYALDLTEASDVLLVERIALGDTGGVSLLDPACAAASDLLACGTGAQSPIRTAKYNVPAGEYRVAAESVFVNPVELTAFVRKAVPPVLVPFADGCADAIEIPAEGGRFQGTTANATADFSAGCDQGGTPGAGATDQLLKLTLTSSKRVVLDMSGSAYTTLLDVRKGPDCPGEEVFQGCAVGFAAQRSYLDLLLAAGTYYVQIDGYALASGPWFLDVRVVDP